MAKHILMCAFLLLLATISMASTLTTTPIRMAFDGDGNILVTDYTFGQVLTVTPDELNIISEININGRPLGVAWADGLIYVGNSTKKRVEVFNEYGQNIFDLGHGQYSVDRPQDIAITDNVYVVDGSSKDIKVFEKDGTYITTIGEGVLSNPTGIAVSDRIFVSDYGDFVKKDYPSIKVLDKSGNLLYIIKSGQPNKFRFSMPQGLALKEDKLYLVDALTSEIHIFKAESGMLLGKVKGSGIKEGIYGTKLPLDIIINEKIYVTDSLTASIRTY